MMATLVALQKQKQSAKLSMIKKIQLTRKIEINNNLARRGAAILLPAGQLCNCCALSIRTVFIFIVVIPLEPNYLYLIFCLSVDGKDVSTIF